MARDIAKTDAYQAWRYQRKKVEMHRLTQIFSRPSCVPVDPTVRPEG